MTTNYDKGVRHTNPLPITRWTPTGGLAATGTQFSAGRGNPACIFFPSTPGHPLHTTVPGRRGVPSQTGDSGTTPAGALKEFMADTDRWNQEEADQDEDVAQWLCPTCQVFISGTINARGLIEFNCPHCGQGATKYPASVRRNLVVRPPFREWTACRNPFCRSKVHVLMDYCPRCRVEQDGPIELG